MTCNYQWLPSLNIISSSSWWDDWVPRTPCLWEVKRHRDKGEDLTQEAGPGHAWDTLAGALVGSKCLKITHNLNTSVHILDFLDYFS